MSDKLFNLVYRNDHFAFKHKLDLADAATAASHNINMAEIIMRNHRELEAVRHHHELERFKYRAIGMGAVGLGLAGVGIAV